MKLYEHRSIRSYTNIEAYDINTLVYFIFVKYFNNTNEIQTFFFIVFDINLH